MEGFVISEKIRNQAIKKFSDEFDPIYITAPYICESLEDGLYNYTRQYCNSNWNCIPMAESIYLDVLDDICKNCESNNKSIKKLRKLIYNGKFNPYNVAYLPPHELNNDCWIKILARIQKTEDTVKNLPAMKWKPCKDCKCVDHFYFQLQTRSNDEAITTFYVCKNCEKTTSINN